jgi:hypothetical protein
VVPSVTICDDEQVVLQRHFDSLQRIGGGGSSSSLSKLKASPEPQNALGIPSLDLLHATDLSSTHSSHINYDNPTDAEASTKVTMKESTRLEVTTHIHTYMTYDILETGMGQTQQGLDDSFNHFGK